MSDSQETPLLTAILANIISPSKPSRSDDTARHNLGDHDEPPPTLPERGDKVADDEPNLLDQMGDFLDANPAASQSPKSSAKRPSKRSAATPGADIVSSHHGSVEFKIARIPLQHPAPFETEAEAAPPQRPPPFPAFVTGSNKSLKPPSAVALAKRRALFADLESDMRDAIAPTENIATAVTSVTSISAPVTPVTSPVIVPALASAPAKFEEPTIPTDSTALVSSSSPSFSAPSSTPPVSSESHKFLPSPPTALNSASSPSLATTGSTSKFGSLFFSASNKKLAAPSAAALEAAARLVADDFPSATHTIKKPSPAMGASPELFTAQTSTHFQKPPAAASALPVTGASTPTPMADVQPKFTGFVTGSNKKMAPPSAAALRALTRFSLFADDPLDTPTAAVPTTSLSEKPIADPIVPASSLIKPAASTMLKPKAAAKQLQTPTRVLHPAARASPQAVVAGNGTYRAAALGLLPKTPTTDRKRGSPEGSPSNAALAPATPEIRAPLESPSGKKSKPAETIDTIPQPSVIRVVPRGTGFTYSQSPLGTRLSKPDTPLDAALKSPFRPPRVTTPAKPPTTPTRSAPANRDRKIPLDPQLRSTSLLSFADGKPPVIRSTEELLKMGMPADVIRMDLNRAFSYRFGFEKVSTPRSLQDQFREAPRIGHENFFIAMLAEGASMKLLKREWVSHHYQLIVWKLASMERMFPERLTGRYLTAPRVLKQLMYRYDIEVEKAKRTALQLISEGDMSPSVHLVVCVAQIVSYGSEHNPVISDKPGEPARILVTDGWQWMVAVLDDFLALQLAQDRIFVGQKLHICNAQRVGEANASCELPLDLAIRGQVAVKLSANGVRRAKWYTKLGRQRAAPFAVNLPSIKSEGGAIPSVVVVLERRYPMLYYEATTFRRLDNTVEHDKKTRTVMEEQQYSAAFEREHDELMESLRTDSSAEGLGGEKESKRTYYERVVKAVVKSRRRRANRIVVDPNTPVALLEKKRREEAQADQEEIESLLAVKNDEVPSFAEIERMLDQERNALITERQRNVVQILPILIVDCPEYASSCNPRRVGRASVSLFGANESTSDLLVEGRRYRVYMLAPATNARSSETVLQLRANDRTRWIRLPNTPEVQQIYRPRVISPLTLLGTEISSGDSFDTVVALVSVKAPRQKLYPGASGAVWLQEVFFCDSSYRILIVQIRSSKEEFTRAFPTFAPNQVLVALDLIYRRRVGNVAIAATSDKTLFSPTIRGEFSRAAFQEMQSWRQSEPVQLAQTLKSIVDTFDIDARQQDQSMKLEQPAVEVAMNRSILTTKFVGRICKFASLQCVHVAVEEDWNTYTMGLLASGEARDLCVCQQHNLNAISKSSWDDFSPTAYLAIRMKFEDISRVTEVTMSESIISSLVTQLGAELDSALLAVSLSPGAACPRLLIDYRSHTLSTLGIIALSDGNVRWKLLRAVCISSVVLPDQFFAHGECALDNLVKQWLKEKAGDCAFAQLKLKQLEAGSLLLYTRSEWDAFTSVLADTLTRTKWTITMEYRGALNVTDLQLVPKAV